MSNFTKLTFIVGGYVFACLVAWGIVFIYQQFTQSAAVQASSGMYAFGDFILFVSVFGFLAIFPTGFGIYLLIKKFRSR